MKSTFFSTLFVLSLLLSACEPAPASEHPSQGTLAATATQRPESTPPPLSPSAQGKVVKPNLQRILSPDVATDQIRAVATENNAFALDLYQSLRSQEGNLVYSPYSISLALAMTYAGARGETEAQMARTLHFLPQDQLHPALNALDLELTKRGEADSQDQIPLQLNIVNAIWAQKGLPLSQSYLEVIAQNYGAGIQLADFARNYEATRKEINDWVSKKTNDKIQDLIPKGDLTPDTALVLVNAIYFQADWLYPFDATKTHESPFHLLNGSNVPVKMMSQRLSGVSYTREDGYQAVELPYRGETTAMDIIVPEEGQFNEFEAALDAQKLDEILNTMRPSGAIELGLPKFSLLTDFSLKDHLSVMGMPNAFGSQADFSGITDQGGIFITAVLHKAFVEVDEEGTEAAAATAVIQARSMPMRLLIDRPFIFVIRDLPSGQILFIGRVLNPAE